MIRHRRLYAFYHSKVLNWLSLIIMISLMQIGYIKSLEFACACAATAFILFICYSAWLWLKKPQVITINIRLSNITIWYVIYFLITGLLENLSWWWYASPVVAAIIIFFLDMVRPGDEYYQIS